jgi:signal transduction histidine kinase
MANEVRRHENPSQWVIAALIVFSMACAAAIVLIVSRNMISTSSIRVETERQLLLLQLESTVQVESEYAGAFAGQLGGTGAPDQSDARSVLSEQPNLLFAIGLFRETAGGLRQIMPASDQRALEGALATHRVFVVSITSLEAQTEVERDDFYHRDTQIIEGALRNTLQDLQQASGRRLRTSIRDVRSAQSMLRVAVPLMLLSVLASSVYLFRMGLARRRVAVLESLIGAKDDFIGAVSHELRTPLTAVVGFADLLHEADPELPPDERAELVASLAEQSHEVSAIVGDLLAAARAEIGELTVVSVPINLRAQAAQVLELQANRSIDITGDAPKASGDPARVRQIIRNLVSNAARYGGDRIRIELGGTPLFSSLRVTDNGEPIPMKDRQRIFELYERAHHGRATPDSMGLGLSISRILARLMDGHLTYDHRNGHSIFELTLPTATHPDALSHESVEGATTAGREAEALLA